MDNLEDKLGIQLRRYALQAISVGHIIATGTVIETIDI